MWKIYAEVFSSCRLKMAMNLGVLEKILCILNTSETLQTNIVFTPSYKATQYVDGLGILA